MKERETFIMPSLSSDNIYILLKVKVKVKLSLCFNWAPRHEGVLEEWRYSYTHSLTSELNGGEQLHAPAALPPGKERWYPLDRRLGGPLTSYKLCVFPHY